MLLEEGYTSKQIDEEMESFDIKLKLAGKKKAIENMENIVCNGVGKAFGG